VAEAETLVSASLLPSIVWALLRLSTRSSIKAMMGFTLKSTRSWQSKLSVEEFKRVRSSPATWSAPTERTLDMSTFDDKSEAAVLSVEEALSYVMMQNSESESADDVILMVQATETKSIPTARSKNGTVRRRFRQSFRSLKQGFERVWSNRSLISSLSMEDDMLGVKKGVKHSQLKGGFEDSFVYSRKDSSASSSTTSSNGLGRIRKRFGQWKASFKSTALMDDNDDTEISFGDYALHDDNRCPAYEAPQQAAQFIIPIDEQPAGLGESMAL
jgi:hypothetical protein